jgi:hypothetical protein
VDSTENFLVVKVVGAKATVEAIKPTGEKIESAQLGQ